jgi:hypothetical protein
LAANVCGSFASLPRFDNGALSTTNNAAVILGMNRAMRKSAQDGKDFPNVPAVQDGADFCTPTFPCALGYFALHTLCARSAIPRAPCFATRNANGAKPMTIPELRSALEAIGATTVNARARALNIGRSTCHSIFSHNRKARGITARVLLQMLHSPHLPASARTVVANYAIAKANALAERHRKKFIRHLDGAVQS